MSDAARPLTLRPASPHLRALPSIRRRGRWLALLAAILLAAALLTIAPALGAAAHIPLVPSTFRYQLEMTMLAEPDLEVERVRLAIERAFHASDADALGRARTTASAALAATPDDPLLLHYRGYAAFREATLRPGGASRKVRERLLDEAERDLTRSHELRPSAESVALLGAVAAQRISGPLTMARFGFKAGRLIDEAMALDSMNPRVWLLQGISAFHKPVAFGGGNAAATRDLTKAAALFAAERPAPGALSWGRAEAHAWLGRAHHARGRADLARAEYDTALRIAPGYFWVRDELLPLLAAK